MRVNVDLDDEMLAKDYFLLSMERNPDAKFKNSVKSKKN